MSINVIRTSNTSGNPRAEFKDNGDSWLITWVKDSGGSFNGMASVIIYYCKQKTIEYINIPYTIIQNGKIDVSITSLQHAKSKKIIKILGNISGSYRGKVELLKISSDYTITDVDVGSYFGQDSYGNEASNSFYIKNNILYILTNDYQDINTNIDFTFSYY